jgi:integrase
MRQIEIILPKIYRAPGADFVHWYVHFSVRNHLTGKLVRYRKFAGFASCKTKEEAERNARALKAKYLRKLKSGWLPDNDPGLIYRDNLVYQDLAKQVNPIRQTKRSIRYYSNRFLDSIKMNIGKASYQKYQSELRIVDEFLRLNKLRDEDISCFTKPNALEFFQYLDEKRKIGGKTKNQYLETMRRVWKVARKDRKLLADPWEDIQKFQSKTKPQIPMKRGVLAILKKEIEKTDPQLWLAAQFMYYCFIRPKELRFLQIKHIDLFEGRITLYSDITKSGSTRIVDINETFLEKLYEEYHLQEYPEDYFVFTLKGIPGEKHLSKNHLWRQYDKVREKLKIPKDYKLYGFKHTGAVQALKAGADIKEIQHQMGHSSVQITDEYLKSMVGWESEFFRKSMPEL